MTPSSPRRPLLPLALASLALGLLAGCDKTADEDDSAPPVTRQVEASPSPSPKSPDRNGRKALSAYNAVSNYLKDEAPDLRERMEKAASHFVKDKDKWRERLAGRQRDIQPKIDRLRGQLDTAGKKSAGAMRDLRQELAGLESQRADVDRKLSELESVTSETWKSFRDRLGVDDDDQPPAASPTPAKR